MPPRLCTVTLAAMALGLAGCGQSGSRADAVAASAQPAAPPALTLPLVRPAVPVVAEGAAVAISDILLLATQANPNRQVYEANRAAAAAVVQQAQAWANPELEVSVGRAKARTADEEGQRPTTMIGGVSLKQRLELPGKRASRIDAAKARRVVTEREEALDRLELETEVRTAALAVATASARAVQARHGVSLSAQVRSAVEQRVQAGESDQGDLARAQVDQANAQLAVDAAQAEATAARAALNAWCGDTLPGAYSVTGILTDTPPPVALSEIQRLALAKHPRLAITDAQLDASAAAIVAEDHAWHPDLTLGLSGNRETDTNDLGLTLGIDIPLWNRNAGTIAAAHADLDRLRAERRRERMALQRSILAAWGIYERERQRITGLAASVLPAAQDALRLKLAAFQAGDSTLLDVIDARRTELAAETALTEARDRAAQARIDLHRAAGADPIAQPEPDPSSGVQP